ncbi:MAG: Polyphosphate kinase 2 [Planctomycetota bacterium]|nr:Polyphosphate kinase 2 [Planctomycetota bacterium]
MIDDNTINRLRVPVGKTIRVSDYDPGWAEIEELKDLGRDAVKQRAKIVLEANRKEMSKAQNLLYADNRFSLLIILQGMDASGKDGTIKHVMSGVNPQGCQVFSFKQPSTEELEHDFLWRYARCLPERGRIGIFNRSHYEDVLIARVHPELLAQQKLPPSELGKKFWKRRYESINHFEEHLTRNGTTILKLFLNISKEEQKRRFLERLEKPEKHWKFSEADVAERAYWDQYMKAYSAALSATSTECAPWYVIPADHKSIARIIVADLVVTAIRSLDLKYPELTEEQRQAIEAARQRLEAE